MANQTEIIEHEQKYWKAMQENDVESAVALTRFPCLLSGPKGSRLIVEDEYRKLMQGHSGETYKGLEMKNKLVEILNDETAVITYEAHLNGKTYLDASTWVKEKGNWVCAFHSESEKLQ